jgi:hypothetical protein
MIEHKIWGTMDFVSPRLDAFSDKDLQFAEIFAAIWAIFLSTFGGFREFWEGLERRERFMLIPSLLHIYTTESLDTEEKEIFTERQLGKIQQIMSKRRAE